MKHAEATPTVVRTLATFNPHTFENVRKTWGRKTYQQMLNEVSEILKDVVLSNSHRVRDCYDYLSGPSLWEVTMSADIPQYTRVACYAITGNAEGHYIHVDYLVPIYEHPLKPNGDLMVEKRINALTIKTFDGMDTAYEIARILAHIFNA